MKKRNNNEPADNQSRGVGNLIWRPAPVTIQQYQAAKFGSKRSDRRTIRTVRMWHPSGKCTVPHKSQFYFINFKTTQARHTSVKMTFCSL